MTSFLEKKFGLNNPELVQVMDEVPLWSAPFGLKLLDYVHYRTDISVLDVGCGMGFPMVELALRLGDTCQVYGVDPWEVATNRIHEKTRQYGINNVKVFNTTADKIPLESSSIDLLVSNNGFNNVKDIHPVLDECNRVCKRNAQVLATMNMKESMKEFYQVFERVLLEFDLCEPVVRMNEHINKKRKPVLEISDNFKKHGFSISKIIKDHFHLRFANGIAMFNHYFMRLAFVEEWMKLVEISRHEEVFSRIEKELNDIASNEGGLSLTIPYVLIEARKE